MKNTLYKILTGLIISSNLVTLANAESYNQWSNIFQYGILEFQIKNNKNQQLIIDCNISDKIETEHSVIFLNPNDLNNNDQNRLLSLKFNGKLQPFPPEKTRTKTDATTWKKFTTSLSNANKIEVIKNGKIVATFFPTFKSMETIQKIKSCIPMKDWPYN